MPGKRNLARERAAHDAPGIQARIFSQLSETLPAFDRALIGQRRILDHLHSLGLRRLNGQPLPWRHIVRWRLTQGFPLLSATWHPRCRTPAVTTQHAVTAWVLSRRSSGEPLLFRVVCQHTAAAEEGNAPQELASKPVPSGDESKRAA